MQKKLYVSILFEWINFKLYIFFKVVNILSFNGEERIVEFRTFFEKVFL